MSNAYRTYDVFTPGEEPFTGNPLALFLDATNFSESLMSKIAQEFNLSETCFIKPVAHNLHEDEPSDGLPHNPKTLQRRLSQPGFGTSVIPPPEYALRIFTTRGELPFAGHPVIGAAHYLGDAGLLGKLKDGDVRRLLVAAGVVDLRYRLKKNGRVDTVELAAPEPPQFEEAGIPLSTIAAMVSLSEHDVIMTDALRPMFVSCGSPYLLIPVAGAEALGKVCPDNALRERAISERQTYPHTNPACISAKLYCYAVRGDGAIEARMFPVPGAGHAEDPATGAAAACLAAYLTRHTLELEAGPTSKGAGRHEWVVQQGAHIGRPSVLYAAADRDARGAVTRAYVGGAAVMVAYGALRL